MRSRFHLSSLLNLWTCYVCRALGSLAFAPRWLSINGGARVFWVSLFSASQELGTRFLFPLRDTWFMPPPFLPSSVSCAGDAERLPITCRRPNGSLRVHSKPQAGGGQVERFVRQPTSSWCTTFDSCLLYFPIEGLLCFGCTSVIFPAPPSFFYYAVCFASGHERLIITPITFRAHLLSTSGSCINSGTELH